MREKKKENKKNKGRGWARMRYVRTGSGGIVMDVQLFKDKSIWYFRSNG
jgi:hypothetical protein